MNQWSWQTDCRWRLNVCLSCVCVCGCLDSVTFSRSAFGHWHDPIAGRSAANYVRQQVCWGSRSFQQSVLIGHVRVSCPKFSRKVCDSPVTEANLMGSHPDLYCLLSILSCGLWLDHSRCLPCQVLPCCNCSGITFLREIWGNHVRIDFFLKHSSMTATGVKGFGLFAAFCCVKCVFVFCFFLDWLLLISFRNLENLRGCSAALRKQYYSCLFQGHNLAKMMPI